MDVTDEKVAPALTREEWAKGERRLSPSSSIQFGPLDFVVEGSDPQEAVSLTKPQDIAAAVAACNAALPDDHPGKIGEDMVDAMEDAADLLGDGVADEGYKMALSKTLRTHAAALRALLPPEAVKA